MPSISRQVGFNPVPVYSRPPGDDETYVMKAFARHASHCSTCAHPYEVHRRGDTLCDKGHQRAVDVAKYVYNKGGKAYSEVDRENRKQVQIEIPRNCEPVRELLRAMERGLSLTRQTPQPSYDDTYYVAPRKVLREPREPRHVRTLPRLEIAEPPSRGSASLSRGKSSYARKGSLYEQDMREREKRYWKDHPVYYSAAPRVPPPVPSKDYYW
ncbi:hypothetical protein MMC20_007186 [Loxospora ochrophaea]|nr:hypothetical protein [Loxospora ochrophaea]